MIRLNGADELRASGCTASGSGGKKLPAVSMRKCFLTGLTTQIDMCMITRYEFYWDATTTMHLNAPYNAHSLVNSCVAGLA